MAKIKYVGQHDAVRVPLPLGGEAIVEQGCELNTTDAHAASLAEQDKNWCIVPSAKKEKSTDAGVAPENNDEKEGK